MGPPRWWLVLYYAAVSFNPAMAYFVPYLSDDLGVTKRLIHDVVIPAGTYGTLVCTVLVAVLALFMPPVLILLIGCAAGILVYGILAFARGYGWLLLAAQALFGLFVSAEAVFHAVYADGAAGLHVRSAASTARALSLGASVLGSLLGELLVYTRAASLRALHAVTLGVFCAAALPATVLAVQDRRQGALARQKLTAGVIRRNLALLRPRRGNVAEATGIVAGLAVANLLRTYYIPLLLDSRRGLPAGADPVPYIGFVAAGMRLAAAAEVYFARFLPPLRMAGVLLLALSGGMLLLMSLTRSFALQAVCGCLCLGAVDSAISVFWALMVAATRAPRPGAPPAPSAPVYLWASFLGHSLQTLLQATVFTGFWTALEGVSALRTHFWYLALLCLTAALIILPLALPCRASVRRSGWAVPAPVCG